MSIFSAVFSCTGDAWRGTEADVSDADSIDDVADLMRDAAGDCGIPPDEATMVLMMEADDEWFGIVRVDDHDDPRVFLSDVRFVHEHAVAALLLESGEIQAPDEPESSGQKPQPVAGGDELLLADLGTPAVELRSLTQSRGMLPGDALAVLAEHAGFAESLDALRI